MKDRILCADDYGMSDSISKGIYDLASQHRLDAISCMTDSPFWKDHQKRLKDLPNSVDIGLHLNLTHPFTEDQVSLNSLILESLTHSIDKKEVYKKFQLQWDNFCQIHGKQPDFIDGHQHVHVFPQVRDVLRELLLKNKVEPSSLYIRNISKQISPYRAFLKRSLLKLLSLGFDKTMADFKMNIYFGGIYDFNTSEDFSQLLEEWITLAPKGTIIMCHPAMNSLHDAKSSEPVDVIAKARGKEYTAISVSSQLYSE